MYKYILFDLDGTLIEPKEGITRCVAYALNKFGIEVKNLDDLTVFIGPPLIDSFMLYYNMSLEDANLAVKYYRERFKVNGILECELYEKLIIATSKPEDFTNSILKRLDIYKYFDLVVGATLDGSRGEKSGVIKYALEQLNLDDLNKAIMVGDRKFDILGAIKNNIDSIGVSYGYGIEDELIDSMPTFIVNDIKDILNIVNEQK